MLAIVLSTLGIVSLIWSEIWLSLAASIWACVQILNLGNIGYAVLAALLVPVGAWASWHTARLAWLGESHRVSD